MKPLFIRYSVRVSRPAAHLLEVRCALSQTDPDGQRFALPAWIPGSYLIRDFARHIVSIRAESGGCAVRLVKLDKHSWQAAPVAAAATLTVICEVYAWDLSVRGAHVDRTHAFFNGSSVFLRPIGQERRPCLVDIQRPEGPAFADWRVATALPIARGEKEAARRHGFGLYRAADYHELIDYPCEMGTFSLTEFTVCGVTHEVAISGRHDCDMARLTADLARLCAWQIRFFGEPAPMASYLFLVTAIDEGYGGLEHRCSTALLCSRDDLPYVGMRGLPKRYRAFLRLCSHEYFHAWNVKRIKPAAFADYDLNVENYTTLLWAFEGFTSYYDDLALLRSGLIDARAWLDLIAETIDKVQRDPGRKRQTLAESSFDAWTKYYRPNENTPNVVVNYYAKGALVALALDLTLRAGSRNRVALDDVMRALWQRYGQGGNTVGDEDIRLLAEELSGQDLRVFFSEAVNGTAELPLSHLLKLFGIRLKRKGTTPHSPSLGVRIGCENNELRLNTVIDDGPAQAAGLAAGDVLLAIDGLRVTPASLPRLLERRPAGTSIEIHAFRRDELMVFKLQLAPPPKEHHQLVFKPRNHPLRKAWLGA